MDHWKVLLPLTLGGAVVIHYIMNRVPALPKSRKNKTNSSPVLSNLTSVKLNEVAQELMPEFEHACHDVKTYSGSLSTHQQLEFYALYKQAHVGPCVKPPPSLVDMTARAKYDSWKKLGAMDVVEAQLLYISLVEELLTNASSSSNDVSPALEDEVDHQEEVSSKAFTPAISTLAASMDVSGPEWEIIENAFYFAQVGNLSAFKEMVCGGVHALNAVDEDGRTALHWACDRNQLNMITYLLEAGAQVNVQDSEGATPLWYAVNCEYEEAMVLLLDAGADVRLEDHNNESPWTLAEEGGPIHALLVATQRG